MKKLLFLSLLCALSQNIPMYSMDEDMGNLSHEQKRKLVENKLFQGLVEKNIDKLRTLHLKTLLNDTDIIKEVEDDVLVGLLWIAVLDENVEMVEFLSKKISELYIPHTLYEACKIGNKKIVELLLQAGADPNIKSSVGDYPLHAAALKGDKEMVELLLKAGANPNVKDIFGIPYLYYTIKLFDQKNNEIIELLLQAGLDPNILIDEKPLLHYVVSHGDKEKVELLLNNGANVDMQNKYMYKVFLNPSTSPEIKKLLLSKLDKDTADRLRKELIDKKKRRQARLRRIANRGSAV